MYGGSWGMTDDVAQSFLDNSVGGQGDDLANFMVIDVGQSRFHDVYPCGAC